ncbi:N-acetylmuramoyl-L-alanine amidase [Mannheimia massilioguelmaensis]|uniref:N-acetylmuramoyl-L-alanine amidase n=1 Tax=Mannheimia massilioguelmaensis TaxID=1604354 RepID=UPI0005CAD833|nr:N-acetylmuramoyl-L-alanine amidase [Mannheimia massilioguelmaensis]
MKRFFTFIVTALYLTINQASAAVWTIAIDPGHGGKDPGAISRTMGMYEKNVTLSIASELKSFLDKDPNFRAVLTRRGDYYISVPERSEIARKNKANYLISIHADSSTNPELKGASVWVLSNRRANDEMGQWLEDHEKQSELLGGAGSVLSSNNDEKYLNQTVLDLQFGHSQRAGYELGNSILRNFSKITDLSRSVPQHASLGVLRSPDIPSVLIETGYLSNIGEEAKLSSPSYRKRIAYIIYQGLVDYRNRNTNSDTNTTFKPIPISTDNSNSDSNNQKQEKENIADSGIRHKVASGETIAKIAQKYHVKSADIVTLNKLKRQDLYIGESIKIPGSSQNLAKEETKQENNQKQQKSSDNNQINSDNTYIVKSGDTLYSIANKYKVKESELLELNKLKNRNALFAGKKLKIPASAKPIENAEPEKSKDVVQNLQKNKVEKSTIRYQVKSGDNISKLAEKFGIKSSEIIELNNLKGKNLLVGAIIKLPDNAKNVPSEDKPQTKNTTEIKQNNSRKTKSEKVSDKATAKTSEKTKTTDNNKKSANNEKSVKAEKVNNNVQSVSSKKVETNTNKATHSDKVTNASKNKVDNATKTKVTDKKTESKAKVPIIEAQKATSTKTVMKKKTTNKNK